MEQTNHLRDMLALLSQPAFCVEDGVVVLVNQSAAQWQVEPGYTIASLLLTGTEEYANYTAGELYLTLSIAQQQIGATVIRIGSYDIFLLDQEKEQGELHALSLAAQQLREPLAGIMAAADRLFPKLSHSEVTQAAHINHGLFQLLRLISNMSDASRYTQCRSPLMETVNITAFFEEVFASTEELVSLAEHTLRFDGLSKDLYCLANRELLERAVYNMISNAMKFSPKGTDILASLRRENNKLYLTIADNGEGIRDSMHGKVFSGFLREPGITDGRLGLGLGMVLVRAAASAHGGTVLIQQPENGGTKVTLTIALRQNDGGLFKAPVFTVDYAGERDHGLIELSDTLPSSVYEKIN